jgi:hypothetical protein
MSRLSLAAENLALRQQVAVYKYTIKRPKLRPRDRVFWVLLSKGKPGALIELDVEFQNGRRHLPVVRIRRAA